MDGRTLLQLLMEQSRENPNSLANKLKNRSLQSQLQRFLDGRTSNPRASTLQPVAQHYHVDVAAFLSADAASKTASALGLTGPESAGHASEDSSAYRTSSPVPIRPRPESDVTQVVTSLAYLLKRLDPQVRRAIGTLLEGLADRPEDGELTASRIKALIDATGNEARPRSSASPPSGK